MKEMHLSDDASGQCTGMPSRSPFQCAVMLAAGVPKSVPVPATARHVLFSATGNIWVQYGGPAAIPTDDDLSGGAPELNPSARMIDTVATLGLVAPVDCLVSLCFYG